MTVKETTQYDNFLGKKQELPRDPTLAEFLGMEAEEQDEKEKLWVGMPELAWVLLPRFWRFPKGSFVGIGCGLSRADCRWLPSSYKVGWHDDWLREDTASCIGHDDLHSRLRWLAR